MENVIQYAENTAQGFKEKADHNKSEALTCFILILVASLTAPIFIMVGKDIIIGKVIPSSLSVIAAGLTSWLQLRKPQKLWSMYRGKQRLIEDQVTKYKFKIDVYKGHETPEAYLAEKIADLALSAHEEWTAVVPSPELLSLKEAKK